MALDWFPSADIINIDEVEKSQTEREDEERTRLLAIKQSLLVTGATHGWVYVKQMAQNIVNLAINEAIDCEDRGRAEMAWLEARATKHSFEKLFATIEATKQFDPDVEPPEWFSNLSEWTVSNERAHN